MQTIHPGGPTCVAAGIWQGETGLEQRRALLSAQFLAVAAMLNFNKFSGVLLLNLAARLGLWALVARLLLLPPTQVISGLKVGFILFGREYIRRGVMAPGPLDSGLPRPGCCLQGTLASKFPIPRPWPLRQRQPQLCLQPLQPSALDAFAGGHAGR